MGSGLPLRKAWSGASAWPSSRQSPHAILTQFGAWEGGRDRRADQPFDPQQATTCRGVVVPHTGFEPVISALRGRCPGPLDECGPVGAGDVAGPVGMIPATSRPHQTTGGASGA